MEMKQAELKSYLQIADTALAPLKARQALSMMQSRYYVKFSLDKAVISLVMIQKVLACY